MTDREGHMGTGWMTAGTCNGMDPEVFFPRDGLGVEVARRVCAGCPVRSRCLDYALSQRIDHGVWGGESERERRRMALRRHNARSLFPTTSAPAAASSVPPS